MDLSAFSSRVIPLNELPAWSPWPARIFGLSEWKTPTRDVAKVDKQYDKEEYLRCLEFARAKGEGVTADDVRAFELRLDERGPMCMSQKEVLYEIPAKNVVAAHAALMPEVVGPFVDQADVVVELGCGFGLNLWELHKTRPGKQYRGGEYSKNAVELAKFLYAKTPNIQVEEFNYYDTSYAILERIPATSRVVVFTRHSIEQLPTAKQVIESLSKYFDRIVAVVHLDVVQENYADTLLGLMRKRYVVINDYNRDILSLLKARRDVEILRNEPDAFGINPFNPTNILVWKPKK